MSIQIALILSPYKGAVKGRRARISPITPCFAAEYANRPGDSLKPATEATSVMHFEELIDSGVVDEASKVCFSLRYATARRAKYSEPLRLMSITSVMPVGVCVFSQWCLLNGTG